MNVTCAYDPFRTANSCYVVTKEIRVNRAKKEEIRKYKDACRGLTAEQVKALDAREAVGRFIEDRARSIHVERFSEEYDFQADSVADAYERSRGMNPMSAEYIAETNKRREEQGVAPLTASGYAESDESLALCRNEALREIDDVRTRVDEILFYKWDPIRLSNSNTARDEYTMYVEKILQVAITSQSPEPLSDQLTHLSTQIMGAPGNRKCDIQVAELIFAIIHRREYYPDHPVIEVD